MHARRFRFAALAALLSAALLVAPAAANPYKLYYGLFHAHSSEGGDDGKQKFGMSMADAYEYAKTKAKLDFFSLSPHAHMISAPVYEKLVGVAKASATAKFAPLFGAEWGNLAVTGHIGTYLTPVMDHTVQPTASDQYAHMNRYFRWLEKQPRGFAMLNHPELFNFGHYYNPIGDRKVVAIEAFNGSAFQKRIDAPNPPMSFEGYILQLLNRGWHAGLVANQDNHFRTWGLATHARTGVYAKALTPEALEEAFHARRVFATTNKNLAVWVEAKDAAGRVFPMGAALYGTDRVQITVTAKSAGGEAIREILLFSDAVDNGALGGMVARAQGVTLVHNAALDLADRFFVAKVTDANGNVAWASPIWATRATSYQVDLNRLVILKRQLEAARKHLEFVGPSTPYGKVLANAVTYLASVDKDFAARVYSWVIEAKGEDLRTRMREVGGFLDSLPPRDAILLRADVKRIARQLALTSDEKEFLKAFLAKIEAAEAAPANEAALLAECDELIKAKNFDGAALVLIHLTEKFPANAAKYRLKLIEVYGMVEAFSTVLVIGEQVMSQPSLPADLARQAYLAVALTHKRNSDKAPKAEKPKHITLSINQYLQLLKDHPNQPESALANIHTLLGDRYDAMMRLVPAGEKEKFYTLAVKSYNAAFKYLHDPKKVIAQHEKITKVTFSFKGTLQEYLKALEGFQALLQQFPNDQDAKQLYKSIADLYVQCAGAAGAAAAGDKDRYLSLALEWYDKYLKAAPPRDKADLYYQMGKVLQLLKRYDKAEPFFAAVAKENWRSTKLEYSMWYRAQCLQKMGKLPEAAGCVRTLLDKFPNFDYCIKNSKGEEVENPADSTAGRYYASLAAGRGDFEEMPPMEGVAKSLDLRFALDDAAVMEPSLEDDEDETPLLCDMVEAPMVEAEMFAPGVPGLE